MIEIELPIKLVSESNNTDHWTVKRERKKMLAMAIKGALKTHSLPPPPLQITMIRISPRSLDDDNLRGAFKAVRDILAVLILGGKMGRRDNDPRIVWQYGQETGGVKQYGIKIQIAPLIPLSESTEKTMEDIFIRDYLFSTPSRILQEKPEVSLDLSNEFGNPNNELLNRLWPQKEE